MNKACAKALLRHGGRISVRRMEDITRRVAQSVFSRDWAHGGMTIDESGAMELKASLRHDVSYWKRQRRLLDCGGSSSASVSRRVLRKLNAARRAIRRITRRARNATAQRHSVEMRWDASCGREKLPWERRKRINGTLRGRAPIPPLLREDGTYTSSCDEQQQVLSAIFAASAVAPRGDDPCLK
jgi:hypothetical protein